MIESKQVQETPVLSAYLDQVKQETPESNDYQLQEEFKSNDEHENLFKVAIQDYPDFIYEVSTFLTEVLFSFKTYLIMNSMLSDNVSRGVLKNPNTGW